jgi:hypothetical protein
MEPIATYSTSRPFVGKARFELLPDAIRIAVRTPSSDSEQTFPLAQINPNFGHARAYSVYFQWAFWGVLLSFIAFFGLLAYQESLAFPCNLLGVILAGFIVAAFAAARKIEFVQFVYDSGPLAFVISRVGKRPGPFDEFISRLVDQIKKCKEKA